uniref:F-box domain-containing protein n=3 Tax=Trichobilharzia regenti TaxID=157069 RepID=A0AA85KPQ2_TRIRE|nr:unnamed protein product [Trichobilharzia regenti]
MDTNIPILYSNYGILPFYPTAVNHVEHRAVQDSISYPCRNDFRNGKASMHYHKQQAFDKNNLICPKCHSQCLKDMNWCSGCGELLIGTAECRLNDGNCEQNKITLSSVVQQDNALNTNDLSSNVSSCVSSSFPISYENDMQFPNAIGYACHSLLSTTPETHFDVSSYTESPSLSSENSNKKHLRWNNSSPSTHTSGKYHISETNTPHHVPFEYSHTKCDVFSVFPNVSTDQLRYQFQRNAEYVNCVSDCNINTDACSRENGSLQFSVLNSANNGDNTEYNQFCQFDNILEYRQRRTSGPINPMNTTNTQNMCHVDSVPSSYGLTSHASPVRMSNNASHNSCTFSQTPWSDASASEVVANLLRETQISLSANNSIPSKPSAYHLWPFQEMGPISQSPPKSHSSVQKRGGFCRRKHPSECSITENSTTVQNPGMYRARSFSSDFENSNYTDVNLAKLQPRTHWQSSRGAWSAQDPAMLKKKPAAYLLASYSQGNVASDQLEPNTVIKQNNSNIQSEKSQCQPNSCTNTNPFNQRRGELNNALRSSLHGRPEGSDKYSKSNRSHPVRRNRGYISKSLSISTDSSSAGAATTTTTNHSIANLPKEVIASILRTDNDPIDKIENENNVVSPNWLLLPDELWLEVLRYGTPVDRVRVAQTCRHLFRLSMDRSLWRVIHLHRQHNLTDADLVRIGNLKPRELRFTYCRGDSLTASGLKRMFLVCGPGLQKLSLIGCTKGPFDHDIPLRLVADHCHNLKHVNASYTQAVRDQTVIALAKSATHLISVKLNGAQQISNAAIQQLVHYHQRTLERLELFGCFRLNSSIFSLLSRCQELRALAFGHLHHLSSDGLLELVSKLPHLSSLDLRGTQTFSDDDNLSQLAAKCPHLEEVVLANMHSLKRETGIAQMLRLLPRLRVLDLCGLAAVGDLTMEVLATNCRQLEELDVSCTSVTQKGLFHLTNAPAVSLKCLRISHCREITNDVLERLIKACPKLTLLYAYGFVSINDWGFLQKIRPTLLVESGI